MAMMLSAAGLLLALVISLAIYDARTQRVPNKVNGLLLAAGLILHFPGTPVTWLACLLLFTAWYVGALGGGDAKLWMALLWFVPPDLGTASLWMVGIVFWLTAGLQVCWRTLRRRPIWGQLSPGAWRAIPFALWLVTALGA